MKQTRTIAFALMITTTVPLIGCGGSSSDGINPIAPASPGIQTSETSPKIETVGTILALEDSTGDITLLGEMTNTGNADASFVEIKCSFYNQGSILIGEDFTYAVGRNTRLVQSGVFTNTVLKPSDRGAFRLFTLIKKRAVARYECKYTYNVYITETPRAKLELFGQVNAQSGTLGRLELLGQVKNTGIMGLTFGQVYFLIRDKAGRLVDIDSSYLNGETVVLSTIGTTDTALSPNAIGTFSVTTSVPFIDYKTAEPKYEWRDATIENGIAKAIANSQASPCCAVIDEREKSMIRNQTIQALRDRASTL